MLSRGLLIGALQFLPVPCFASMHLECGFAQTVGVLLKTINVVLDTALIRCCSNWKKNSIKVDYRESTANKNLYRQAL